MPSNRADPIRIAHVAVIQYAEYVNADARHAPSRMAMPSACGKSFFLYSSRLPQTAHASSGPLPAPSATGSRWSQPGHCHSFGPGRFKRPSRSHTGQAKRTFTRGIASHRVTGVAEEQHARQLAQEAEDHDDVQETGRR